MKLNLMNHLHVLNLPFLRALLPLFLSLNLYILLSSIIYVLMNQTQNRRSDTRQTIFIIMYDIHMKDQAFRFIWPLDRIPDQILNKDLMLIHLIKSVLPLRRVPIRRCVNYYLNISLQDRILLKFEIRKHKTVAHLGRVGVDWLVFSHISLDSYRSMSFCQVSPIHSYFLLLN